MLSDYCLNIMNTFHVFVGKTGKPFPDLNDKIYILHYSNLNLHLDKSQTRHIGQYSLILKEWLRTSVDKSIEFRKEMEHDSDRTERELSI